MSDPILRSGLRPSFAIIDTELRPVPRRPAPRVLPAAGGGSEAGPAKGPGPQTAKGPDPVKGRGPKTATGRVPKAARKEARKAKAAPDQGGARQEPKFAGGGRLLPLALGALVALALLAVAAFLLPSALLVRSVEVVGATSLGSGEVVAASLIVPGSPLLSMDTASVAAALEAYPPIAKARVTRVLPDRVRIEIVERRPVALALDESEGRSSLVAIDAEGVSFGRSASASLPDIPILSGIRFEGWKPGTRLPDFLLETLASLAAVEATDPALLSLFSEIRVERSRWGELELLLFPLHYPLPVRTGPTLDPALLRSIVLVLDALSPRGLVAGVDEIDFRTGTIVFRTKEGHSGST